MSSTLLAISGPIPLPGNKTTFCLPVLMQYRFLAILYMMLIDINLNLLILIKYTSIT